MLYLHTSNEKGLLTLSEDNHEFLLAPSPKIVTAQTTEYDGLQA